MGQVLEGGEGRQPELSRLLEVQHACPLWKTVWQSL
jgi:hypothetical protein